MKNFSKISAVMAGILTLAISLPANADFSGGLTLTYGFVTDGGVQVSNNPCISAWAEKSVGGKLTLSAWSQRSMRGNSEDGCYENDFLATFSPDKNSALSLGIYNIKDFDITFAKIETLRGGIKFKVEFNAPNKGGVNGYIFKASKDIGAGFEISGVAGRRFLRGDDFALLYARWSDPETGISVKISQDFLVSDGGKKTTAMFGIAYKF